ncbi:MAG: type II secretion system F family protein [Clostridiales Family XIII bacterium]|jgi:tight adherence protein C|nr:type II secretion system F family protein [Clostridiales Family XIII bacterium]
MMVLLILASIFVGLLTYGVLSGEKYADLCAPLDSGDYPLKSFYIVGFALSLNLPFLKAPKKLTGDLRKNATLLFSEVYADYYASVAWAQFLSLSLLLGSVILLIGAFFGSAQLFFFLVCAVVVFVVWNMSVMKMGETVKNRAAECNDAFPNAVSKLALLINSGMVLREAWKLTAQTPGGQLYELMRRVVDMMDNGASDIEALYKFGVFSDSQEIKKFSGAVIQSLEKGGGNLADYLLEQASALLEAKRQEMLRKGEIAAGKLIAPIGIMFAGVMLIILAAALQSMSF